ncbi:type II secretion system F family protein [Burkholderia glumae]|uniref:type II secretion system F family protein n=2 Tax=Burkholderia glumae TaxID=337 RepID=UPI000C280306|nr:type II secretion system F family protein [Burkholderia glumae]MCM2542973.1 type II secretion system F family protein [Burkholderia glumae]MCQ0031099.1 type II secretion system F family protein [Burkholderia glumae]MCQ0034839.1 type II secretion system F family protein [Burkholderia glumae]PJO24641.1 type II secretion system protein [Burkholderia glumae AU6208]QHE10133.1 type II secretion system F family protein [Burkholderia glumae AU6208]
MSAPPTADRRFRWAGLAQDGTRRRGTLIACDASAARRALRRRGITVLALDGGGTARAPAARARDVTRFTHQLGGLLRAGLPLAPALELLADAGGHRDLPRIAAGLARAIGAGRQLSEAMRQYPRQFDPMFRQLVAVGEASGTLAPLLARVAADRERGAAQRARVRTALAYPLAVLAFSLAISAALLVWVVPTFAQIFDGFGARLPAPTRFVLTLSATVARAGPPAAIAAAAAGFTLAALLHRSAALRLTAARATLRLPLVGPLLRTLAAARWSRTLGTLLRAGTPLADAFDSLAQATGNPVFDRATDAIAARLLRGERLAQAMRAAGCFPDEVVQPVAVAEESGTLDAMLADIATLCERQVDERIALLTSLCEPLVVVVLGALVGGLVVAMYLPIVQLGNVV